MSSYECSVAHLGRGSQGTIDVGELKPGPKAVPAGGGLTESRRCGWTCGGAIRVPHLILQSMLRSPGKGRPQVPGRGWLVLMNSELIWRQGVGVAQRVGSRTSGTEAVAHCVTVHIWRV